MEKHKERSSNGNLVNVGNFDRDGANVNNWKPGNVNDNLGVSFSRSLSPPSLGGVFVFHTFQPGTDQLAYFQKTRLEIYKFIFINNFSIPGQPDKNFKNSQFNICPS